MNTPKETAEVILIVIKRIIKWILITGVLVGIGVTVIFEISEWYSYQTYGKYEEQKNIAEEKSKKKVVVDAFYPKKGECLKDYPYEYIIFNESEKTIEKVQFTVEIRKKGFSNVINSYTYIDNYKILKPKEGWGGCFRAQGLDYKVDVTDKDVDVVVKDKYVTFVE
jgi:hypothetical protein